MSLADERKLFFQLATEAGMTDDLTLFAKYFGRFQGASIELADGRTASYEIPRNVRLSPINGYQTTQEPSPEPSNNKSFSNKTFNDYAKARLK
ncbi:TPA: hypothetical protein ACVU4L_001950 [Vibrio parahaemolyticus]